MYYILGIMVKYKFKLALCIMLSHILIGCANTSEYDLKCPDMSQSHLRALGICRKFPTTFYACLLDTNSGNSKESCNEAPDYSSPGEKYVISGARTTVSCSSEKYQPFLLWANKSSDCLYKKSKCKEEGQIESDNNLAITDQTCMCDHAKDFHYISNPTDQCACVPSKEDCSCYYDPRRRLKVSSDHLCLQPPQTTDHLAVDFPREDAKSDPATTERLKAVISARSTGFRLGFLALLVVTALTV
ncbi:uncharacterized protein LOC127732787 [Mytilus californianus]|uniref:uncharacterized protein LOC127732787 n=1 Tax=Mytilus californianus TaxID=6549 RepID=UPI002246E7BA|nr:uncharacterized protein LOC127732787 [Mytilus californianus]